MSGTSPLIREAGPRNGRESLWSRYQRVRLTTERLCEPLVVEDYGIQAMPDVSPPKWHLAHTSWFFETFVLAKRDDYRPFDNRFAHLFNSYYEGAGRYFPRAQRGLLSRPTVEEIYGYRAHVDQHVDRLFERGDAPESLIELGLHHEQQHQELLLTDIKYNFSINPLDPVYCAVAMPSGTAPPLQFTHYEGGIQQIGHAGDGFAFDNESPRHRLWVEPYRLANRPVTNGEFLEFIAAGGYQRAECWLSDGWQTVTAQRWEHPPYWRAMDHGWEIFTLGGLRPLNPHEPVVHISYYEADAYARWAGKRLPTEAEWEIAARGAAGNGNFLDTGTLHPIAAHDVPGLLGNIWEWTQSPYLPYPGFRPWTGALGEYNGKFMCNQIVLRGGSCVTPADHIRATYRNFFYPWQRWQFSGVRLADSQA